MIIYSFQCVTRWALNFMPLATKRSSKKYLLKKFFTNQNESKLEKTLYFFASTNLQNGMKTEKKKKLLPETLRGKIYFSRLTPVGAGAGGGGG